MIYIHLSRPEIKIEQWALAINYTATWCTQCGSLGGPLINELHDLGKIVCLSIHTSGDPMAKNLYESFNYDRAIGEGVPSFWIGDKKHNGAILFTLLLN